MKAIVPALLLCCFIIKACGSTFEGLDEKSNIVRYIPDGGSAETAPPVSSSDSESGDANVYRDIPVDEEESENESETSVELHPSADDDDDDDEATDLDEDHEDDDKHDKDDEN